MKIKKVENYDAGYSKFELLKKCTAAAAVSTLICGGLASCNSVHGGIENHRLDGDVAVSSDEMVDFMGDSSVVSSYDEMMTLDGDVAYVSSDGGEAE